MVNNETKNVGNEGKTQQPSFAEKLRYNFLTLIFKKPKESDAIINDDPYYFDYNNNDEIRTNITDGTVDLEKDNESQDSQEFNKEMLSKL